MNVEFEVLTAVAKKNAVVWVVTVCSSETTRRFGGIYSLHLQIAKYAKFANTSFMFDSVLSPEDEDDMFLRNV
jgi:hypothetical protein